MTVKVQQQMYNMPLLYACWMVAGFEFARVVMSLSIQETTHLNYNQCPVAPDFQDIRLPFEKSQDLTSPGYKISLL